MTIFILVLSTARTTVKANLGPKIFVVNLTIMNLVNALCGFVKNIHLAFPDTLLIWFVNLFGQDPYSTEYTGKEGSQSLVYYLPQNLHVA